MYLIRKLKGEYGSANKAARSDKQPACVIGAAARAHLPLYGDLIAKKWRNPARFPFAFLPPELDAGDGRARSDYGYLFAVEIGAEMCGADDKIGLRNSDLSPI